MEEGEGRGGRRERERKKMIGGKEEGEGDGKDERGKCMENIAAIRSSNS